MKSEKVIKYKLTLENGDIVKLRNGEVLLKINDEALLMLDYGSLLMIDYDYELKELNREDSEYDIMEVYTVDGNYGLGLQKIFERIKRDELKSSRVWKREEEE